MDRHTHSALTPDLGAIYELTSKKKPKQTIILVFSVSWLVQSFTEEKSLGLHLEYLEFLKKVFLR